MNSSRSRLLIAAFAALSLHLLVIGQILHYQASQVLAVVDRDYSVDVKLLTQSTPESAPPESPASREPQKKERQKTEPQKPAAQVPKRVLTPAPQAETSAVPTEKPTDPPLTSSEAGANADTPIIAAAPLQSETDSAKQVEDGSRPQVQRSLGSDQASTNLKPEPATSIPDQAESQAGAGAPIVKPEVVPPLPGAKLASLESLYRSDLAAFPGKTSLVYAVHSPKDYQESSGASGEATVQVESEKTPEGLENFNIHLEIKLAWLLRKVVGGSLIYKSDGKIGRNGPQTLRYSEKIGDRAERWLEVDRTKREMKSHQIPSLALQPGTQDRLSVIWLLSMLARSDPELLGKGKVFSVPMFSFRQVYPARFESYGNEVLLAPAGVLQTLHIGYQSTEAGSDRVDLWLGYEQQMQPVRIRWQEAQGRVLDLILLKKP